MMESAHPRVATSPMDPSGRRPGPDDAAPASGRGVSRFVRGCVRAALFAWLLAVATSVGTARRAVAVDQIEFLSGAKIQGTVIKIDKVERRVTMRASIAGRQLTRVYPYQQIHAVTYQGKRYILNKKADPGASPDLASGDLAHRGSPPRSTSWSTIPDAPRPPGTRPRPSSTRPDWICRGPSRRRRHGTIRRTWASTSGTSSTRIPAGGGAACG